jgi:hypothetical protein
MPDIGVRFGKIGGRQIALLLGALVLGYVVLTAGLANVVAKANPTLAVQLDGGNAQALGQLAYNRMITAQDQDDVRAVNELSRRALAHSPMQVGALRNLGFLAEVDKRPADARALMMTAVQVSRRDALTQAWLFTDNVNSGKVGKAVEAADVAMRMSRSYRDIMTAELLRVSKDKGIVKPMIDALAKRPDWRARFMAKLNDPAGDPDNLFLILSGLKQRNSAPSNTELSPYFSRFDGSGNVPQLWARWSYLTPEAKASKGLIRDGGFEGLEAPPPFNWTLFVASGVYAERERCPDGCPGKVLYLSYEGNTNAAFAHQMLALKPGRYRLRFRVYAEDGDVSGIAASMRCGSKTSTNIIFEKPFEAKAEKWVGNNVDFVVQPNCRAQQLYITGKSTGYSDSISAWLDDVTLVPAGAAARARPNADPRT